MATHSSLSPLEPIPPPNGADQNTQHVELPPSAVAVERLFSMLRRSSAVLRALRDFDSAALNIKHTIEAVTGGDTRVELLQNHIMFITGAPLRTFVLRVSGKTLGAVAEFILPADGNTLHSLPAKKFIQWVRAFKRGEFGVPDIITPAQHELLVDFACIWEGFATLPHLDRGGDYFRLMLRWLATENWVSNPAGEDGGFVQLSMLSKWAREQYPYWFEELEDDPEMPDLVTVYGSDSDESVEDA
ncbi:hypothetical protein C8T65DRAFT_745381 [Cerioporus squamosus]|nr:hypothetical protein C8T65DRAFT_745381 [Cerioporus squamosus]